MRLSPILRFASLATATSCLQLLSSPVSAQQSQPLPGITVQGATLDSGRVQQPPPAAPPAPSAAASGSTENAAEPTVLGVPIETIGNAVTVITGEDLRRQQVRNAADALRSLPGVAVNRQGGVGSITQVRIRGAEIGRASCRERV